MATLKERIENHLGVFFLGALLVGFIAGISVYEGILRISDRTTIARDNLQVLNDKLKASETRITALKKELESIKTNSSSQRNESQGNWVYILSARIKGKQGTSYVVSPQTCTPENPCTGKDMVRGVTLYVDLNQNGYAAAYLQDQGGYYYNQEGRLFIRNLKTGSTKIWPGIPGHMAHQDFNLWIVTSDQQIPIFPDSKPLEKLPVPSNGQKWGPIHLIFERD